MVIQNYKIYSNKIPASFDKFKIAHISDLHNKKHGEGQYKLLDMLKSINPDIIVLTGDVIVNGNSLNSMDLLKKLPDSAPVLYVYGNHEAAVKNINEYEKILNDSGIVLLNNSHKEICVNSEKILFLGIKDPAFGYPYGLSKQQAVKNYLVEVCGNLPENYSRENVFTVLLSHRPECMEIYSKFGIDLILSGHAHGGQFRFPFKNGFFAPGQGFFPKLAGGYFNNGSSEMIVSRGAGNGKPIPRICNPYEVVAVELNSAAKN